MKALTCEVILTSASTRSDGSLGLRFATPELKPVEKTALFELQGHNLKMLLQPMAEEPDSLVDIKTELDTKTPSQRLRAVFFVLFRQLEDAGKMAGKPFELFYTESMNRLIEDVKGQLEPQT
jgi:hypothetical protein